MGERHLSISDFSIVCPYHLVMEDDVNKVLVAAAAIYNI